MKILPITSVSANNVKHSDSTNKLNALPKAVDSKQNLANPTFKGCGATMAAVYATCSTFGVT